MSNLVIELLLRLIKPLIAVIIGLVVYLVAVGLGEPASISLALISFLEMAISCMVMLYSWLFFKAESIRVRRFGSVKNLSYGFVAMLTVSR